MKIEVSDVEEFWDGSANLKMELDQEALAMLVGMSITSILKGAIAEHEATTVLQKEIEFD
tara:strand:+ start:424 stop:603 length:180 start_codon:yes stop_codon:yes gene_type:complete